MIFLVEHQVRVSVLTIDSIPSAKETEKSLGPYYYCGYPEGRQSPYTSWSKSHPDTSIYLGKQDEAVTINNDHALVSPQSLLRTDKHLGRTFHCRSLSPRPCFDGCRHP